MLFDVPTKSALTSYFCHYTARLADNSAGTRHARDIITTYTVQHKPSMIYEPSNRGGCTVSYSCVVLLLFNYLVGRSRYSWFGRTSIVISRTRMNKPCSASKRSGYFPFRAAEHVRPYVIRTTMYATDTRLKRYRDVYVHYLTRPSDYPPIILPSRVIYYDFNPFRRAFPKRPISFVFFFFRSDIYVHVILYYAYAVCTDMQHHVMLRDYFVFRTREHRFLLSNIMLLCAHYNQSRQLYALWT